MKRRTLLKSSVACLIPGFLLKQASYIGVDWASGKDVSVVHFDLKASIQRIESMLRETWPEIRGYYDPKGDRACFSPMGKSEFVIFVTRQNLIEVGDNQVAAEAWCVCQIRMGDADIEKGENHET